MVGWRATHPPRVTLDPMRRPFSATAIKARERARDKTSGEFGQQPRPVTAEIPVIPAQPPPDGLWPPADGRTVAGWIDAKVDAPPGSKLEAALGLERVKAAHTFLAGLPAGARVMYGDDTHPVGEWVVTAALHKPHPDRYEPWETQQISLRPVFPGMPQDALETVHVPADSFHPRSPRRPVLALIGNLP